MALDDKRDPNRSVTWCKTCFNWIYLDELHNSPEHAGWLFYRGWVYCPECQKNNNKVQNIVIKAKLNELIKKEKKRYFK